MVRASPMSPLCRASSLVAVLLAVACATSARAAIHVSYVPASAANYSHHARPRSAVRLIIVHVTEGTFASAVSWFRNPHAHASANYVVSREGAVTQMVRNWHVAWHSGNRWVNLHSIGVEDEGLSGVAGTFTDAEYRASAELAAGLMRHYLLPIDRRHLIGHNEVPDPLHPGLFGGSSHHTDPGRYWDWRRYVGYVRAFARGLTPPPLPFDVNISSPLFGQTVSGIVPWSVAETGEPSDHVDFFVDGRLRDSQYTAPYAYGGGGWDTSRETTGRHVLRVRAVTPAGSTADSAIVVYVKNPPIPKNPPIRISALTLTDWQTVTGAVRLEARVSGRPLRVEFLIDGVLRDVETRAPYVFAGATGTWDTTQETPGIHTVVVRAIGPAQRPVASRTVHVLITTP
jgi:N-acetyl-anhydromuramyl-L-alanine amidase AmpD